MKAIIAALFLFAFLAVKIAAGDKKCYALVISGGGVRGAYEMGVIKGLVENLPPEEIQWDVLSGISAGSLNSVLISKFPKGQEKDMVKAGLDLWANVKQGDVYKDWPLGLFEGLLFKSGIYDVTPLYDTFRKIYKGATPQRKMTTGSVDANTGWFQRYTEAEFFNKGAENFFKSVVSSASIPAVFEHVSYDKRVLVDGGTMINLDIGGAVERCREIVKDQKDIIVDVVLAAGATWVPINDKDVKTKDIIYRVQDLNKYRKAMDDLIHEMTDYRLVNFRYIVWPSAELPGGLAMLDFNPKQLKYMIELGEADLKKQLRTGPNGNLTRMKEIARSMRPKINYIGGENSSSKHWTNE